MLSEIKMRRAHSNFIKTGWNERISPLGVSWMSTIRGILRVRCFSRDAARLRLRDSWHVELIRGKLGVSASAVLRKYVFPRSRAVFILDGMQQTGQAMQYYVAKRGLMCARLSSKITPTDGGFLITMFVESFGDRSSSPFRTALPAFLTKSDFTRQLVTLRLLQELASQQASRMMRATSKDSALVAQQNKNENKGRTSSSGNSVGCRNCGKTVHIKTGCFKRSRDKSKYDASRRDKEDQALVTVAKKNNQSGKTKLTASQNAFNDSLAVAHTLFT